MSALVEIGKTRNCVKTLRPWRRVCTQFLVFSIYTRVYITVYIISLEKCFLFLKYNTLQYLTKFTIHTMLAGTNRKNDLITRSLLQ